MPVAIPIAFVIDVPASNVPGSFGFNGTLSATFGRVELVVLRVSSSVSIWEVVLSSSPISMRRSSMAVADGVAI